MTDRLFIRHPDHPERNGYVTRTAFDALWSKKGYVPVEAAPAPADDLNAELDRRAGIEPPTNQVETIPEPPESPEEEKARLTARLEAASVQVDRRWGLKRLRIEAANLGDPA